MPGTRHQQQQPRASSTFWAHPAIFGTQISAASTSTPTVSQMSAVTKAMVRENKITIKPNSGSSDRFNAW